MHHSMQSFLSYITVYLAFIGRSPVRSCSYSQGGRKEEYLWNISRDPTEQSSYGSSLNTTSRFLASGGGKSTTSKTTTTSSTSKSSPKTSSSYSSYHGRNYASSSYRYTPSSYRPMYVTNLLTFLLIYDIAHIEMSFMNVDETQYCPLKYCRFINETTINTPLRRNVSMAEMIRQTNHTQNATTFQTIWKTTYGCSIDFDECLTSHADSSFSYFAWTLSLQYGMMIGFLFFYG